MTLVLPFICHMLHVSLEVAVSSLLAKVVGSVN